MRSSPHERHGKNNISLLCICYFVIVIVIWFDAPPPPPAADLGLMFQLNGGRALRGTLRLLRSSHLGDNAGLLVAAT